MVDASGAQRHWPADLHGRCACSQVQYEVREAPLFVQACHCSDCQRTTGSAFVIHMLIVENDLSISGDTRMALVPTGSGAGCELHSCISCGVIVWVRYRYHQVPVIAIRAGTLIEASAVAPQAHIFWDHRHAWVNAAAGIPVFAGAAPREGLWPQASVQRYNALPPRRVARDD